MTEHTEQDDRRIREALQQSLPAVNTELQRDLWPEVLRKLDAQPALLPWYDVPWYDWALIGLSAGVFLFFPQMILVFVYHI
jgi:hypothetical protein